MPAQPTQLPTPAVVALSAAIVAIAAVYLLMAFGLRRGDMVWSGRHPRRLPPKLRRRSLAYSSILVAAALLLLVVFGVLQTGLIGERWIASIAFGLSVFFGLTGLASLVQGTAWEQILFAPALLGSALLTSLIAFA